MIDLCSSAALEFCVVSTEGKISLAVPIHMRVSVYTWMHGHVDAMDHMYVWVYVCEYGCLHEYSYVWMYMFICVVH